MYKILIVDDEKMIRDGIKNTLPWTALEIEEVFTAGNVEEAEQVFQTFDPEIVITDIRMPGMSGLELLAKLKQIKPGVKVIILSGFDDFSYAQTALKFGAFDYLLKTADCEELAKSIQKAVAEIRQAAGVKDFTDKRERQLEVSMPLLKQRLLTELIGGVADWSGIIEELELAGIRFRGDHLQVAVFDIDEPPVDGEAPERKVNIKAKIFLVIEEAVRGNGICFESKEGEPVCIFDSAAVFDQEKLVAKCAEIQAAVLKNFGFYLSIGIGNAGQGLVSVPVGYREAKKALEYQLFLGMGSLILFRKIAGTPEINVRISPDWEKKLVSALRTANKQEVMEVIGEFFEMLFNNRDLTVNRFQDVCLEIFNIAARVLNEFGTEIGEIMGQEFIYFDEVKRYKTFAGARERILLVFERIAGYLLTNKILKNKKVIEQIRQYIEAHFNEDLTLQKLAEIVYMSPNYLSSLFSNEAGQSFLEYLTGIRIEKAKQLLGDKDVKIGEAGERVGYLNPQYFTKIFKKYTGMTPSEYKEYLSKL